MMSLYSNLPPAKDLSERKTVEEQGGTKSNVKEPAKKNDQNLSGGFSVPKVDIDRWKMSKALAPNPLAFKHNREAPRKSNLPQAETLKASEQGFAESDLERTVRLPTEEPSPPFPIDFSVLVDDLKREGFARLPTEEYHPAYPNDYGEIKYLYRKLESQVARDGSNQYLKSGRRRS